MDKRTAAEHAASEKCRILLPLCCFLRLSACLLFAGLVLVPPAGKTAERETDKEPSRSYLGNFIDVPLDVGNQIYTRTVNGDPEALIAWLAIGGAFLLDEEIREAWHRNIDSPRVDRLSRALYKSGTPLAGQVAIGLGLSASWLLDDRKMMNTAALATQSIFLTQAFAEATKWLTGRLRPNESEDSSGRWREGGASFFSGHASGTWGVATVVAERYPDGITPYLAYGWASAVSLSRINDDGHWASDVITGALAGYLIGKSIVKLNPLDDVGSIRVMPLAEPGAVGLALYVEF